MKYAFADTETTGLDREKHNIWQFAMQIVDAGDVRTVLDELDLKFRPFSMEYCEDAAFAKCGITREYLEKLPMSSQEAFDTIIAFLAKHCNRYDKKNKLQLVAYNAAFDSDFIRAFFKKHNDDYYGSWFWTPSLCVMQGAAFRLKEHRDSFPNFQLGTLCKAASLPWDETKAHDALYDIRQTRELFLAIE